jgi:hypothetical protein
MWEEQGEGKMAKKSSKKFPVSCILMDFLQCLLVAGLSFKTPELDKN